MTLAVCVLLVGIYLGLLVFGGPPKWVDSGGAAVTGLFVILFAPRRHFAGAQLYLSDRNRRQCAPRPPVED